jgi:hypothetical protein
VIKLDTFKFDLLLLILSAIALNADNTVSQSIQFPAESQILFHIIPGVLN